MKTSKKRLIAGITAITCCCSMYGGLTVSNKSGVSVFKTTTVSAAEAESTETGTGDGSEEVEVEVEDDILTSDVTVVPIDGTSWANADGYSYAIADVTITKKGSDNAPVVTTDRVVAITGYTGSSLTLVAHNNASMPEGLRLSLSKAGVDLNDVNLKYSTAVADSALKDNKVIKSIDMAGVEYLGKDCFSGCTGLMTVEIPDTVKAVGSGVFMDSGVSTLFINNKMRDIPADFCEGSNLSQITFANPSSVKTIGNRAFAGTQLTQYPLVDEGSSVEIGSNAFRNCSKITELTLGSKVKSVSESAFSSMKNLTSVDIGSAKVIGKNAFENCTALKTVVLNDVVTSIGDLAFSGCKGLETFPKLPESVVDSEPGVEGLGKGVFNGCTGLSAFTFSDSVTNIPDDFFSGCNALKTVTFGKGITNIGNSAFKDCTMLSSVIHENVIRDIGNYAFSNCRSLPNIIANKCKTIGAEAYYGCVSIKSINLDAEKCGEAAFKNCSGIKTATLAASIAENLPKNMFLGCSGLTEFVDTDFSNVQVISEGAFTHCVSLKQVDFPSAVKILPSAFENCKSLTRISDGDLRVESYGDNCFKGCTSLEQNINSSVVEIGTEAFSGSNIKDVILRGAIDRSLHVSKNAFANCASLEHVSIQIPEKIEYSFDEGVFSGCTALTNVQFGGTAFSDEMFSGCTSLVTVTAKNITDVGARAFADCTALESFVLGEKGVFLNIYDYAFENCTSLKETYCSTETRMKGDGQYCGCSSITSANVITLTAYMFKDCINLSDITGIPDDMGIVPDYALYGCKKITSLDFLPWENNDYAYGVSCFENSGLTGKIRIRGIKPEELFGVKIGDRAFANCDGITEVELNVNTIGNESFTDCNNLLKATVAALGIGDKAFYGCTNMHSVEFPMLYDPYGMTSIGAGAFQNCNLLREVVLNEWELADGNHTAGKICKIGDKAFGFIDDTPINNFLLVGVLKNRFGVETGVSKYIESSGIMFQDINTYDPDIRAEEKKLLGDLNLDGEVTVADAVIMQRWLTRQEVSIYAQNADVNEDGAVNVFDNILIKRIIMNDGQLPETPEQPVVTTTVVEEPTETTTTTVTNATAKK